MLSGFCCGKRFRELWRQIAPRDDFGCQLGCLALANPKLSNVVTDFCDGLLFDSAQDSLCLGGRLAAPPWRDQVEDQFDRQIGGITFANAQSGDFAIALLGNGPATVVVSLCDDFWRGKRALDRTPPASSMLSSCVRPSRLWGPFRPTLLQAPPACASRSPDPGAYE